MGKLLGVALIVAGIADAVAFARATDRRRLAAAGAARYGADLSAWNEAGY